MRPRVFPAEDADLGDKKHGLIGGFNEAAGIPRGRPHPPARNGRPSLRFNEAAGIPRGRPRP